MRLFNNGTLRRVQGITEKKSLHSFFDQNNASHNNTREQIAMENLELAMQYLEEEDGDVAIYDAVNGTKARRDNLVTRVLEKFEGRVSIIFLELFCTDAMVVARNIRDVKTMSDDYIHTDMTTEERIADFTTRLENYEKSYETLRFDDDRDLSFIRSINSAQKLEANKMNSLEACNVLRLLLDISLENQSLFSS